MNIANNSLERYPINVKLSEQNAIINLIKDQKHKIPRVFEQFDGKNETIYMNAYEQGVMTALLSDDRDKIPETWKQLIEMLYKFRKDAGVEITDLGNDMIEMKDDQGFVITRKKYEWEK